MSTRHYGNKTIKIVIAVIFIVLLVGTIILLPQINNRQNKEPDNTNPLSSTVAIQETGDDNNSTETDTDTNNAPSIVSVTQIGTHSVALTFSADESVDNEFIIEKSVKEPKGNWNFVANTTNNYFYDTFSNDIEVLYRIGIKQNGKIVYSNECEVGYQAKPTVAVACLMYHYFTTPDDLEKGDLNNNGTIMVDELESDLKYLQDNNIRTITCSELLDYINGNITLPEKCVMISVDDGHYSIYKYMVPLLQKYNCKATISVIGDFVDSGNYRTDIPRQNYWMTWNEISEISKLDCIEIGSHSYSLHQVNETTGRKGTRILEGESIENYESVLSEDNARIKAKLSTYDINLKYFAFPYNDPCSQARTIYTENLGYKLLMTGDSDYFSKEKANYYVYSIGDECLETNMIRRIARHSGDNIADLIDSIYDNREYKQE